MTLFANLRAGGWGAVGGPILLAGDSAGDPPMMTAPDPRTLGPLAFGKDVLIATHGFNVSYTDGVRSLGRLETVMAMGPTELFIAALWPGDWIVPVINYPFETPVATRSGALLGAWCNRWLTGARSLSFVSHSLGARVVMEAVKALARPARICCVTAGAVNADCLTAE